MDSEILNLACVFVTIKDEINSQSSKYRALKTRIFAEMSCLIAKIPQNSLNISLSHLKIL